MLVVPVASGTCASIRAGTDELASSRLWFPPSFQAAHPRRPSWWLSYHFSSTQLQRAPSPYTIFPTPFAPCRSLHNRPDSKLPHRLSLPVSLTVRSPTTDDTCCPALAATPAADSPAAYPTTGDPSVAGRVQRPNSRPPGPHHWPLPALLLQNSSQLPVQPSLHAHPFLKDPAALPLVRNSSLLPPPHFLVPYQLSPAARRVAAHPVPLLRALTPPRPPTTSTWTAASLLPAAARTPAAFVGTVTLGLTVQRANRTLFRVRLQCATRALLKAVLGITTFRSCFTPRRHPLPRPPSTYSVRTLTFLALFADRHISSFRAPRPASTAVLCLQHGAPIPSRQRKKWPVGLVRAARVPRTSPTARFCTALSAAPPLHPHQSPSRRRTP